MRIVVTSPYAGWPPTSGGSVRIYNVARALAHTGRDVTLLTGGPVGKDEEFGAGHLRWKEYRFSPRLGYFFNPSFRRAFNEVLNEKVDLLLSCLPYQSRMICGPARRWGVPVVYDAQNLEADRFRKMGQPVMARIVQSFEKFLCRRARAVLAVSEEDKSLFHDRYGVAPLLLPNGVNTDQFRPGPRDESLLKEWNLEGRKVALFCGTLDYGPNLEALEFLDKHCLPLMRTRYPEARLLVVGRRAPQWLKEREGVIVAGAVDDMAAWTRLAHVALAPLRSGGGTRLKILEAMACGQTMLSTPFGAMGIASESQHGLLLAELDEFPEALCKILDNPPTPCDSVGGRIFAEGFDWKRLVEKIDWEELARRTCEG